MRGGQKTKKVSIGWIIKDNKTLIGGSKQEHVVTLGNKHAKVHKPKSARRVISIQKGKKWKRLHGQAPWIKVKKSIRIRNLPNDRAIDILWNYPDRAKPDKFKPLKISSTSGFVYGKVKTRGSVTRGWIDPTYLKHNVGFKAKSNKKTRYRKKKKKRCVSNTKKNKRKLKSQIKSEYKKKKLSKKKLKSEIRKASCALYKKKGTLTRSGTKGKNKVPFSGRIGKRKLARGSYRLVATATDFAGNVSKSKRKSFKIVKAKKKKAKK